MFKNEVPWCNISGKIPWCIVFVFVWQAKILFKPGLVVFVLGGKVGALVDGDDQGGLLETILHLQNKVVENIRGYIKQEKCEKNC